MFKLPFSSAQGEPEPVEEKKIAPPKTSKRSRRRRNMKSRKRQVEPVQADKNKSKKQHDAPMTKNDLYFALDCEMVGTGPEGFDSAVARVTVVNWENQIVLDTFVKVPVPVTDFREHISGISAEDIESDDAMCFDDVRVAVGNILRGKILIGHGLENDLCALSLTHPYCDVRDTACYVPYMREVTDYETGKLVLQPRKLRDLAWEKLGRQIQAEGIPHSPTEDAAAALDLYKLCREEWEKELSIQQMERIREAENQRRARHFFWSGSMSMTPPPASNIGVFDPNSGYSYGGPYGPAVPGFAPSPPGVEATEVELDEPGPQHDGEMNEQVNSSSWRWYSSLRRPKSPSHPQDSIPEECATVPVSPRSSGFFRLRRQRSVRLEATGSNETDNTTVCTDTDSHLDFVSDVTSEAGSNFEPDYSYLQETKWSQSFQVIDPKDARKRGDSFHSKDVYDAQAERHYFDKQVSQRYYKENYGPAEWYPDGDGPSRARFVSI